MRRFTRDLKEFYNDLFELDMFSSSKAALLLRCKTSQSERISYIESVYNIVLRASDENVKAWITSNHSLKEISLLMDINEYTLNSRIDYFEKSIKDCVEYKDSNILRTVIQSDSISEEWSELWDKLKLMVTRMADKSIDKNAILLNIPKNGFCTSVSDEAFDVFLEFITPYFVRQRSMVQQQINEMPDLVGYFHYLNTNDELLSEIDRKRKDRLLALANVKVEKKTRKQEKKQPDTKPKGIIPFSQLSEEEQNAYAYAKSRHVQF